MHLLHYPIERRSDTDLIEDIVPFKHAGGRATFTAPSFRGHQMVVLER